MNYKSILEDSQNEGESAFSISLIPLIAILSILLVAGSVGSYMLANQAGIEFVKGVNGD